MKAFTDNEFTARLLHWNRYNNKRTMPWKGEKNPYLVWLSEIILQQTRVEQGLPYYLRFKSRFPTVFDLASAKEDEVLTSWQGLGYYSRARNLHETARNIVQNHGGSFPSTYNELKKLKGVGDYTAAAIASFVFGEAKAVVDGNVIRLLARYYGIKDAFDTAPGKKKFALVAQRQIDTKRPGTYNQAIMDFGATVCVPQNPLCNECPLSESCWAKKHGQTESLPFRNKKTVVTDRYLNYFLIRSGNDLLIQKRTGADIWKGLYELPLVESKRALKSSIKSLIPQLFDHTDYTIIGKPKKMTQKLSHRNIHFTFTELQLNNLKALNLKNTKKVRIKDLHKFAFAKTTQQFLKEKLYLRHSNHLLPKTSNHD